MQARADFQYLFLYFPGILFLSYVLGLLAGVTGAVASTALAFMYVLRAGTLTAREIADYGLPLSLFLFTGTVIAVAGDQYRIRKEQLRDELRESSRRADVEGLVARVTDVLTSGADRQHVSDAVCKACAETLGGASAIVLTKPSTRGLSLEGFYAVGDRDRAESRRTTERLLLREALTFSDRMLEQSELVQVGAGGANTRGRDDAAVAKALASEGLRTAIFAPLRNGEDAVGYLAVMSTDPRRWDADDVWVVKSVAERVAAAVGRSRRIEQRIRRERNVRLLAEAMIEFFKKQTPMELFQHVAQSCADSLGEWCGISLLDSESPALQLAVLHHPDPDSARAIASAYALAPLSRDDPFIKKVLESPGAVLLTASESAGEELVGRTSFLGAALHGAEPRPALAARIGVGGEGMGVLTIAGRAGRQWEDEDLTLAAGIADRAGAALANLRVIERERQARRDAEREAQLMEAIGRTVAIASGSPDANTVFQEFAGSLRLLLPFERVSVTLPAPDRDWLTVPYFSGASSTTPPDLPEGPRTGTARGRVLDTGESFLRADTSMHQEFEEDRIFVAAGILSYLVVPMRVGRDPIGTLCFGHRAPGFYTEAHVRIVQRVADHLAVTISRSLLFEQMQRRAGELSETLQRALLPVDLPSPPFLTLGALYQSADPDAKIGGDWYDAFMLPDGRLMVSIGDITGRGLPAATTMGQIRHTVRAYGVQRLAPGGTMDAVNAFVTQSPERWYLSMWLGILDPHTGELVYSAAGHPPPLVIDERGAAYMDAKGPLLGLAAETQYPEQRRELAPGTRLVLYTDGLTEASRDVVESERRLAAEVTATAGVAPHRAVHTLVERMLGGEDPQDDVALLIVDMLPASAPLRLSLPAMPENLWRIRRAIAAFARRQELSARVGDAMVVAAGEAVLNVVEHAYRGAPGRMVVRAERRGSTVVINVRDFGAWQLPVERGRGRGTRIMQGFADSVTSTTGPTGTSIELRWEVGEPS
jgi:serine phosphatase RsbU (regulator of sigma subunit)/anti-sigma regulatory factor (Ser/Thr protein kinase)